MGENAGWGKEMWSKEISTDIHFGFPYLTTSQAIVQSWTDRRHQQVRYSSSVVIVGEEEAEVEEVEVTRPR